MKTHWDAKTGLAKAALIFATLTLISLGLCGVNFVAFTDAYRHSGAGGSGMELVKFLIATAYVETGGIVIGVVGIMVVLTVYAVQEIARWVGR